MKSGASHNLGCGLFEVAHGLSVVLAVDFIAEEAMREDVAL